MVKEHVDAVDLITTHLAAVGPGWGLRIEEWGVRGEDRGSRVPWWRVEGGQITVRLDFVQFITRASLHLGFAV